MENLTYEIIYALLCRLNLPPLPPRGAGGMLHASGYHFSLINFILHITGLIPFKCLTLQLNYGHPGSLLTVDENMIDW